MGKRKRELKEFEIKLRVSGTIKAAVVALADARQEAESVIVREAILAYLGKKDDDAEAISKDKGVQAAAVALLKHFQASESQPFVAEEAAKYNLAVTKADQALAKQVREKSALHNAPPTPPKPPQ